MTIDIAAVLREHIDYYADPEGCSRCDCGDALSGVILYGTEVFDALAAHQAEKVEEHLRQNGREEWGVRALNPDTHPLGKIYPVASEETADREVARNREWRGVDVFAKVRRHVITTDWEEVPADAEG